MTRVETFVNDFDYADMKQTVEAYLCQKIDDAVFTPYYDNMSYIVPFAELYDRWDTIRFMAKLLANDLNN